MSDTIKIHPKQILSCSTQEIRARQDAALIAKIDPNRPLKRHEEAALLRAARTDFMSQMRELMGELGLTKYNLIERMAEQGVVHSKYEVISFVNDRSAPRSGIPPRLFAGMMAVMRHAIEQGELMPKLEQLEAQESRVVINSRSR